MGQLRLATGAVVNCFFVIPRFECASEVIIVGFRHPLQVKLSEGRLLSLLTRTARPFLEGLVLLAGAIVWRLAGVFQL